jgi:hypothetical protein
MEMLESSAGTGHIIKYLRDAGYNGPVTAFEIDEFKAANLKNIPNISVRNEDFLSSDITAEFDIAIINPPFSVEGNANCFVEHVQKTHKLLKAKGKMASVLPTNWLHSNIKKLKTFREWLYQHGKYYMLDKEAFKESGTLIQTCVIIIDKADPITEPYANYRNHSFYLVGMYKDNESNFYTLFDTLRTKIRNDKFSRDEIWAAYEKVIDFIRSHELFLPWLDEWKELVIEDFIQEVEDEA